VGVGDRKCKPSLHFRRSRSQKSMIFRPRGFDVTALMCSYTRSPHLGPKARPLPPLVVTVTKCSYIRYLAVKRGASQVHSVSCLPLSGLDVTDRALRQAETERLNAYHSGYTRPGTCANPPQLRGPPPPKCKIPQIIRPAAGNGNANDKPR
jgi:hypothetical protein